MQIFVIVKITSQSKNLINLNYFVFALIYINRQKSQNLTTETVTKETVTKAAKGRKRKSDVDEDDLPILQTKSATKALLAAGLAGSAKKAPAAKKTVEGDKEKTNKQAHDAAADVVIVAPVHAEMEAPSTNKKKKLPKAKWNQW